MPKSDVSAVIKAGDKVKALSRRVSHARRVLALIQKAQSRAEARYLSLVSAAISAGSAGGEPSQTS